MKILILCTGNSCRSQMAEGFFKHYEKDWNIYSAGIEPKGLNENAVKVMMEKGIDISKQTSNNLIEYLNNDFDYVITVCDNAKESCPVFSGAKNMLHWSFKDPADAKGSNETIMSFFREIRDEIDKKIKDFLN